MLKVWKVVFAAFMQHCIESNGTHVGGVKVYSTLYTGQSTSPRRQFCFKFLGLVKDAQPTPNS